MFVAHLLVITHNGPQYQSTQEGDKDVSFVTVLRCNETGGWLETKVWREVSAGE